MQKILIVVGSTRRPKLNAVREALSAFGPSLDSNVQFDVVGVEVESGVGHTPTTRAELMTGARHRAEALALIARERPEASGWRYFVGLEGGLDVIQQDSRRIAFLENWAYVCDAAGRSTYGPVGRNSDSRSACRRSSGSRRGTCNRD